jgi:pyruvate dehydrogenase E2 component (dihydrolipoamide acetyltransferase)
MPIEITMPALSPTMTEGNLAKWLKNEGDTVLPGDVIAEIETDKATMEVESVEEGIIGKIIVPAGTNNVKVNAVIALLLTEGEDKNSLKDFKIKAEEPKEIKQAIIDQNLDKVEVAPVVKSSSASFGGSMTMSPVFTPVTSVKGTNKTEAAVVKASPIAKRIAKEAAIDIGALNGTGPKGRIVKSDVEEAIRTGGVSGRVSRNLVEVTEYPNDNMRKIIANRLLQSKQHVPHFYLNVDCILDNLLEMRKVLNDEAFIDRDTGQPVYKLSVNDFIIKAVGKAMYKVPQVNATWTEEKIYYFNNIDIAVAVAIEGGLITPIVKNADQKKITSISIEMKELAKRARDGKLAPEEFQGGGFSISNLGMYGIKNFNAIINPPQACILAVGAGEERAVVKNGVVVPATVMTVTLSCDHRVVDGAVGAMFLAEFKKYIESPVTLLI